jgi:hypothetical protein
VKSIKGTVINPGIIRGDRHEGEIDYGAVDRNPRVDARDVYTFICRAIHRAGLGINFVADIDRTLIAIDEIVQKLRRT